MQQNNKPKLKDEKRASILLVAVKPGKNNEETIKNIEAQYKDYKQHVKCGDIIENIYDDGERARGVFMYDGQQIIKLDYDMDDYGLVSKEFLVFKEFNPNYWHVKSFGADRSCCMDVNKVYIPNGKSQFYWHSDEPNLIWIAIEPLRKALAECLVYDEDEKYITISNYIYYTFENIKYKVIAREMPEEDQQYMIGGSFGDHEIILGLPF